MKFKKNNVLEGEIIDFTHEGNGVIKIENFVFFVSGGVIGDKVEFRINEIKKSFGIGEVTRIIEPSEDRVSLDFEINESRGTIPLIEYNYNKQLSWKRDKVINDFNRIGKIKNPNINNTIGMKKPYGYRNHVQIPVRRVNNKNMYGFYELNSHRIIDMDSTILLPEVGNKAFKLIKKWIEDNEMIAYDEKTKKGNIRHIGIRVNDADEVMVILVTNKDKLSNLKELKDLVQNTNIVSIHQNINSEDTSMVYSEKYRLIYGDERLKYILGDIEFMISPNSFFQVNQEQAKVMYDTILEYLEPRKDDIVYDLFCGIGSISLYIANKVKEVYGIEVSESAIIDANKNKDLNNIKNVVFLEGKSEEVFPKQLEMNVEANKLILDPPRSGCEEELLHAILELSPEKIIYVSCDSATLARDLKILLKDDYKLVEAQPIDMFANTSHIEVIALLTKSDL